MKIGVVILATNAYFVLGIRFMKKFMQYYKGGHQVTFYFFSDVDPEDYLPENIQYQYYPTRNKSWVDGTNLKFTSIIKLEDCDADYMFYFDADTNIDKDFTEEWFLGDSVGGQHYGDQGWMKTVKAFDRNPISKAYVPLDTALPQMYYYGAFFGGTKDWMISFCKLMYFYQVEDKKIPYEPGVNDESYINREFHFNPPAKVVATEKFAFLISDKGGLKETRNMDLDIEPLKKKLLILKDVNIDIRNGEVV